MGKFLQKFADKLGDRFDATTEAKKSNTQVMSTLANEPAQKTNPLLIIIPVAVILIGGVTAFILLRKKK